jgi:hypothetical protein
MVKSNELHFTIQDQSGSGPAEGRITDVSLEGNLRVGSPHTLHVMVKNIGGIREIFGFRTLIDGGQMVSTTFPLDPGQELDAQRGNIVFTSPGMHRIIAEVALNGVIHDTAPIDMEVVS